MAIIIVAFAIGLVIGTALKYQRQIRDQLYKANGELTPEQKRAADKADKAARRKAERDRRQTARHGYSRADLRQAQAWWRRGGLYATDAERQRAAEIAAERERGER